MKWSRTRRKEGPTSTWYQREADGGRYVARKAVSRFGERTRFYGLKMDARGNLTLLGSRFRGFRTAMEACERDARLELQRA